MATVFHFPPDLLNLLIDTIPLLCRSKQNVLTFFQSAGVPDGLLADLAQRVREDRENIGKHEIARTVLVRLNEQGDATLRQRREVIRRVVEYEDFSTCWPQDQLKAKGSVAEVRRVVNVKDSFTRMNDERHAERSRYMADQQARLAAVQQRSADVQSVKRDLYALFREKDNHRRGKSLEAVLNRLFALDGLLVREAFTRKGAEGEGAVEQIDGVLEMDGHLYLVEMKWWASPLGPGEVAQHIVRVFSRSEVRGVFISTSNFTEAAVATCRDALQHRVVVLCTLEEVVRILEREGDLKVWLREKVNAALVDRNPLHPTI